MGKHRFRWVVITSLLLGLLAWPAAAQMAEEGNVARVTFVKVKPGMAAQFEEAVKKHVELHRAKKDTWGYAAWQVISGPNNGDYGFGVFGRRWADFDNPPVPTAEEMADILANIAPYVESATPTFWLNLAKVSRPAPAPGEMEEVIWFRVRPGKSSDFEYAIGKFHEAIAKTNWPVHYEWWVLVNGGEQPTFVLTLPRANFASFAQPEKPFRKMLEEAFGATEAQKLYEGFAETLKGQSSEIIRNRPELGYSPGQ
ncbi:MAG: hypothetical protein HYY26_04440 [Acidobacteria bacterium]|nr:hypothetical protein [Acidobacteriota bacterium]